MKLKCRSPEEYGEFLTHPGEEFLYVIDGVMDLYTDVYKPLRLESGDSVYFDSMTAHAYIAVSGTPPIVLMSNIFPRDSVNSSAPEDGNVDVAIAKAALKLG
jgi:quercetin dioxygenase-like cupin family protein